MASFTDEQILSMSDEELMNLVEPPVTAQAPAQQEPVVEPEVVPPVVEPEPEVVPPEPAPEPEPVETDTPAIDVNQPGEQVTTDKPVEPQPVVEAAPVIDYEAEYKRVMAPFKANGKEVKLNNPDDVIKLMQMGANYTKKMQALQPNLKLLKMLENQGLLDEAKLNNLIDLHKRNPAAIQQLVKDSGLDPLEMDTSKDPGYVPGNHSVSEHELRFGSILEDVSSTQEGSDLVVAIDKQWDDASKQALYNEPEILSHLYNQKQSGVYDQIVAAVERERLLGNLVNVPFIQAYNVIGQHLAANKQLVTAAPAPTTTVVETRPAVTAKPPVNNDKARAASPTKTAPQSVKQVINPLEMSDEDFLKMANIQL